MRRFGVSTGVGAGVAHFAMTCGGGQIMIDVAGVVAEVVRRLNPQGIAAEADQGQDELQDQDG